MTKPAGSYNVVIFDRTAVVCACLVSKLSLSFFAIPDPKRPTPLRQSYQPEAVSAKNLIQGQSLHVPTHPKVYGKQVKPDQESGTNWAIFYFEAGYFVLPEIRAYGPKSTVRWLTRDHDSLIVTKGQEISRRARSPSGTGRAFTRDSAYMWIRVPPGNFFLHILPCVDGPISFTSSMGSTTTQLTPNLIIRPG